MYVTHAILFHILLKMYFRHHFMNECFPFPEKDSVLWEFSILFSFFFVRSEYVALMEVLVLRDLHDMVLKCKYSTKSK